MKFLYRKLRLTGSSATYSTMGQRQAPSSTQAHSFFDDNDGLMSGVGDGDATTTVISGASTMHRIGDNDKEFLVVEGKASSAMSSSSSSSTAASMVLTDHSDECEVLSPDSREDDVAYDDEGGDYEERGGRDDVDDRDEDVPFDESPVRTTSKTMSIDVQRSREEGRQRSRSVRNHTNGSGDADDDDEDVDDGDASGGSLSSPTADVRCCTSQTCAACREGNMPIFIPTKKENNMELGRLPKQWWIQGYHDDDISTVLESIQRYTKVR